jgi:regulatory protein
MALNKQEMTEQQAFQKLSALCARGEHCQYEMLEKMRQWEVGDESQARVMARLIGERYVDDERYARAFVHDKLAYNQWGRRKIEQALWLKRIDKSIARMVLDEIDENEYIAVLKPLLKQKRRSVSGRNEYERNLKLMKWAVGRGFTMDIIRQCMEVEDDFSLDD